MLILWLIIPLNICKVVLLKPIVHYPLYIISSATIHIPKIADLQVMFLALLFAELHSLEEVRFVGRGELVANVVALDLTVPLISLWRLPCHTQSVLVHSFHLHTGRRTTRGCRQTSRKWGVRSREYDDAAYPLLGSTIKFKTLHVQFGWIAYTA